MLSGFKKFVLRGNVVDLAVAVVLGASFGAVVTSLVTNIITPMIRPWWVNLTFLISTSQ